MHSLGYFHRGKTLGDNTAEAEYRVLLDFKGQELIFYFWNMIATTSSSVRLVKTRLVNV